MKHPARLLALALPLAACPGGEDDPVDTDVACTTPTPAAPFAGVVAEDGSADALRGPVLRGPDDLVVIPWSRDTTTVLSPYDVFTSYDLKLAVARDGAVTQVDLATRWGLDGGVALATRGDDLIAAFTGGEEQTSARRVGVAIAADGGAFGAPELAGPSTWARIASRGLAASADGDLAFVSYGADGDAGSGMYFTERAAGDDTWTTTLVKAPATGESWYPLTAAYAADGTVWVVAQHTFDGPFDTGYLGLDAFHRIGAAWDRVPIVDDEVRARVVDAVRLPDDRLALVWQKIGDAGTSTVSGVFFSLADGTAGDVQTLGEVPTPSNEVLQLEMATSGDRGLVTAVQPVSQRAWTTVFDASGFGTLSPAFEADMVRAVLPLYDGCDTPSLLRVTGARASELDLAADVAIVPFP